MSSLPPPPPPAGGTTVCYRHPNRPAFRRCTRCERIACHDCLTQGSVGSLCAECVRTGRPPTTERVRRWNATRGGTLGTYGLMAANIAVAIYTLSTRTIRGIHQGEIDLALNRYFVAHGEWWRIFTSGFTHFGPAHLVINMVSLYFLGKFIEPALGHWKFLALYFASLVAGSAGALIVQPNFGITAGASGAVFGLLGASAIALRQRGIGLMQSGLGLTLLLNLMLTFTVEGISIGGHIGGLVGGAVCGYVMLAPRHRAFPAWASYATPAAVGIISFVVCLLVSRSAL